MSADGPDFDRIVAHYCQMAGESWTDALEAELTFDKVLTRCRYWQDSPPPVVLLMALAIGLGVWKRPDAAGDNPVKALRALFPSGRF